MARVNACSTGLRNGSLLIEFIDALSMPVHVFLCYRVFNTPITLFRLRTCGQMRDTPCKPSQKPKSLRGRGHVYPSRCPLDGGCIKYILYYLFKLAQEYQNRMACPGPSRSRSGRSLSRAVESSIESATLPRIYIPCKRIVGTLVNTMRFLCARRVPSSAPASRAVIPSANTLQRSASAQRAAAILNSGIFFFLLPISRF